jgi:chromosome transmission fidelity protein 4
VEDRRMTQETRLALSPNATLTWLGYSEEGMLATYDSAGILRVFSPEFGGSWVPCFASSAERKGSESFWVFALSIAASEVQCIVCANGPEPTVPSGSARPVVTAAPMRLPVVTSAEEAAAPLEADVMRWGALAAHAIQSATEPCSAVNPEENAAALEATLRKAQVEADRASVKLFAKLVAADRQARALEVAAGLHTEAAFEGARRIAQHHRLGPLAEQVEALMQRKAEVEAEAAMAAREPLMQMNNGGYMQEEHQYQDQNRHREQDELDGVHPSVIAATPALDEAQQQQQQQQQTHALFGKRRANAGVDEQFREENGSPNAAVMNGALGAGNGATRNEGGAKRKAGVVGNPFARKKQAATKKKQ